MPEITVGRIVHYVGNDGVHYPAIVVTVYEPEDAGNFYDLVVFGYHHYPAKTEFQVDYNEHPVRGTFHYPERAPVDSGSYA